MDYAVEPVVLLSGDEALSWSTPCRVRPYSSKGNIAHFFLGLPSEYSSLAGQL
jgi:hypothetical protein